MRRDLVHVPRYVITGPNKGAAFVDCVDDVLDEATLVVRGGVVFWSFGLLLHVFFVLCGLRRRRARRGHARGACFVQSFVQCVVGLTSLDEATQMVVRTGFFCACRVPMFHTLAPLQFQQAPRRKPPPLNRKPPHPRTAAAPPQGAGLASMEALRPQAVMTLCEILHHCRKSLSLEQLGRVVRLMTAFVVDGVSRGGVVSLGGGCG